ncbi:outer dynein arm-docking complex subunit 4-like [Haliotis rubra]|uniref:outer dynein arm-docking complex subunit 4-like n=1 Tax=Haliotis rubra TaxID=36100 RepID=UPI001EE5A5A6|nr:outer dynein arm-docking complex subunit 4-like [Haliotis rubra]
MAASVSFGRQREKTLFLRTRYLFDIYMREGDAQMKDKKYRKAVESYAAALRLDASNLAAHVGKSHCHLRLGHVKQALADAEKALSIDNVYPPAVLQKATIFYTLGNYDMALLFYHRGHKVSPDSVQFQEGIARCRQHISVATKGKTMKLTEAGDLTLYVHKKMRKMGGARTQRDPPTRDPLSRHSSAGRAKKKDANPLFRLGRKQPIKLSRIRNRANQNNMNKSTNQSRASGGTVYSEPDERTMREILGELYGDRVYLRDFARQTDEGESRLDVEINSIAENGLQFLLERVTYWSLRRLPPDPPPSPPLSRKHSRQGSSAQRTLTESPLPRQKSSIWDREVSDLIRVLNEENSRVDFEEEAEGIVGYRPYRKEKKKVRKLHFEFASYRPGSELGGRRGEGSAKSEQKKNTQGQKEQMADIEEEEEEGPVLDYLMKELADIVDAFEREDYEECKRRAHVCLQTVYSYTEDEIADKRDVVARVHSFLGNTHLELGEYEEAQEHHEKDLFIGEECNIDEPISRALGNLGRVFVYRKQFHKALGAFARKTKLVERPIERAWLFHEIGDCFLSLSQYGYARDCGRKSLHAAEEAEHRLYQLQACVLIGVAQVKLREYSDAYVLFERGLDLAKIEGDRDSEQMITRALGEVNTRMSELAKRRGHNRQSSPDMGQSNQSREPGTASMQETRGKREKVNNTLLDDSRDDIQQTRNMNHTLADDTEEGRERTIRTEHTGAEEREQTKMIYATSVDDVRHETNNPLLEDPYKDQQGLLMVKGDVGDTSDDLPDVKATDGEVGTRADVDTDTGDDKDTVVREEDSDGTETDSETVSDSSTVRDDTDDSSFQGERRSRA